MCIFRTIHDTQIHSVGAVHGLNIKADSTFSDHRTLMVNQPCTGLHGVTAQKSEILILVILVINCIGILLISLASLTVSVSCTTFQILEHKKALVNNDSYIIQYLCETGPFRIKFCLQKMAVSLSSYKSVVPS